MTRSDVRSSKQTVIHRLPPVFSVLEMGVPWKLNYDPYRWFLYLHLKLYTIFPFIRSRSLLFLTFLNPISHTINSTIKLSEAPSFYPYFDRVLVLTYLFISWFVFHYTDLELLILSISSVMTFFPSLT